MTPTLLVLLLLSQAERPDDPPAGAMGLAAQLVERRVEVAVNALAVGVGRRGARYLFSGEVRWRFGGWLYALGQGCTLLFPAPDGTLRSGAFASLGLGVDHVR